MSPRLRVVACAIACLVSTAAGAYAQAGAPSPGLVIDGDPSEAARFRVGPLRFTPSILLSNLGVDSNVFNEFSNPKRDTTAAAGPAADYWVRLGRSRLSGRTAGQYLYFKQYDNQRAWNTLNNVRWDLPLGRLTPFVVGHYSDTKNRPGYEIDSRARLKAGVVGGGTQVRLSGKTSLVLWGARTTSKFAEDDTFLGSDLAALLNRRNDMQAVHLRMRLTPLTTFVLRAETAQDRFDTASVRDANSVSIVPGFELRPEALISGSVFVGVRRFNALRAEMPDFTGVVANVGAGYRVRATQVEARVARDLTYSYLVEQPYFALTDVGLTVTQRITSRWDVVGRGSRQWLAYRQLATAAATARTDRSWQAGVGIGYRFGDVMRLGIDAIYLQRQSPLQLRVYEGLRVGASVSYGLPQ